MVNIDKGYLHRYIFLKINTQIFYITDYRIIAIENKELNIYRSYTGTIESKIYMSYGA